MERKQAQEAMAALAQATRLDALAALANALPGGLTVGRLAELLGTPKNTMSTHLAILARAGLIEPNRSSNTVTYVASAEAVHNLAQFLTGFVIDL